MNHRPRLQIEETVSAVLSGVGLLLSIGGLVALVVSAGKRGDARQVVSFAIYGSTLIILYSTSLFYHSFRPGRAKDVFEMMDHSSIYLLIAGSYTPFTLVVLRGSWGWSLFGTVWGLALAGIALKVFHMSRFRTFSTLLYLVMGWLVVIAIQPLMESLPAGGIGWLLAGGLFYTLGVVFYAWNKLPFQHEIWHLFVLGGSLCHFFSIYLYVTT